MKVSVRINIYQCLRQRYFFAVLFTGILALFSFVNTQVQCDLTLTINSLKQPTCGGKDGSFSINATGITAPYQYTLVKDV
ncbi:SprB repeat-containing protein, partial [Nibrella viscosa]|uniref:SprB repeat-containing protein n=1 Tax=Nibrella viscosa TaxID=1084524 RepID=UPI0031E578B6